MFLALKSLSKSFDPSRTSQMSTYRVSYIEGGIYVCVCSLLKGGVCITSILCMYCFMKTEDCTDTVSRENTKTNRVSRGRLVNYTYCPSVHSNTERFSRDVECRYQGRFLWMNLRVRVAKSREKIC